MYTLYDPTYVAKHLGVSKSTVINWTDRPTAAFPMPVAYVRYGDKPRQENPAWTFEQLPLLREWLGHRLALSEPEAHWALIDGGNQPPGGHQDQAPLWS